MEPIDTVMPYRGAGERGDGERQRDYVGRAAGPRPRRGDGHTHIRQGTGAGAERAPTYNGKLKLTTAKYYIPSGRCIQARKYKHTEKGLASENVADSLTHEFRTAAGRIVRDGGGIKPDIEVLPDSMPNIAYYLQFADHYRLAAQLRD